MSENPAATQNELGEVRPCDCGGINLAMGPVTLHFTADEVDALFELVTSAKHMTMDSSGGHRSVRAARRKGKSKVHGSLH